jgi:hypothetical protein
MAVPVMVFLLSAEDIGWPEDNPSAISDDLHA